ncbi:hypothetical protein JXB28_03195 [Candidatus Woesearchaeota archaeon]|nr:hypothetical protein [Candidatus Woesearchaeota archaeon]
MSKRSQMQMTESVFVVFIILIIIVMGFVMFSKFQEASIKENERMLRNIDVIKLAHRMSAWPELECSLAGTERFVCLDIVKLSILGDFINDSMHEETYSFNYYYDLLKESKVIVKEIYPPLAHPELQNRWSLYYNPGKTATTDTVFVPVNLYNPLSETFSMGMLEIQIYG